MMLIFNLEFSICLKVQKIHLNNCRWHDFIFFAQIFIIIFFLSILCNNKIYFYYKYFSIQAIYDNSNNILSNFTKSFKKLLCQFLVQFKSHIKAQIQSLYKKIDHSWCTYIK